MLSGGDDNIRDSYEQSRETTAQPQPIALMADRGCQEEYPVDALGPIMAGAVRAAVDYAYVPAALAAQSCLAAASLAIQGHFDVQLPTGQVRPSTLHLVTVAESGDRKSTADDWMMQPVWAFQEELETAFATDRLQSSIRQQAWDEAKKETTNRLKKSGRAALEEGYQDLGARPESAIEPTIVVRVGTTQALLKRFVTSRPSLGLMSDEGGSWLGGFGMTDDNRLLTISTLSDFWDGKSIQTNTVGEGFVVLRGRRLAFHLMIQPVLAGRLLGNAEAQGQGFLSRLLVSQPESIAGKRIVDPDRIIDPVHSAARDLWRERLAVIVRAALPTDETGQVLAPRTVTLTAPAKAMWWAFYNSIERRLGPDGDLQSVKGFVGKLPEQAARIATNIAVVQLGARLTEIDAEALAMGIAIAEFHLSEALRLFGQASPDPLLADAQALSNWLRDAWPENLISTRAIQQKAPGSLRKGGDYIRSMIEVLVRHDHLSEKLPNGGMVGGKRVRDAWRIQVRNG